MAQDGTSPPIRGNQGRLLLEPFFLRNIPAHTGKTDCGRGITGPHAEHPRPHGENVFRKFPRIYLSGTSPSTRGKPRCGYESGYAVRNIPVHTGKTPHLKRTPCGVPEHPRPHGENTLERQLFPHFIPRQVSASQSNLNYIVMQPYHRCGCCLCSSIRRGISTRGQVHQA